MAVPCHQQPRYLAAFQEDTDILHPDSSFLQVAAISVVDFLRQLLLHVYCLSAGGWPFALETVVAVSMVWDLKRDHQSGCLLSWDAVELDSEWPLLLQNVGRLKAVVVIGY